MAVFVNPVSLLYLDGYDFSNHIKSVNAEIDQNTVDITSFSDTTRIFTMGMYDQKFSMSGFDDYDASQIDVLIQPIMAAGTQTEVTYVAGTTAGSRTFSLQGAISKYDKKNVVGDVAGFDMEFMGQGTPPVQGILLEKARAMSSSANGTGQYIGAVAAGQTIYCFLHVTAASSPVITVNLQNSATVGGTYTTRASQSIAAGIGSYMFSTSSTLADTYWRMSWTWTSGSATMSACAGIR